jgi:PAS domain S-box-containing protein
VEKLASAKGPALLVVFLALVGLAVGVSIQRDYAQTIADAFQTLESQAILAEAKVSGVLRGLDIGLHGLAADHESGVPLPEKVVAEHQRSFLKSFAEIRTVTATDASGQVIAAESLQTPGDLPVIRAFNISGRDYFRFHRDAVSDDFDRMHLSRPFIGSSKRWIIAASRAIRGEDGEFHGAVVATVIPRFFESILQDILANDTVDVASLHNRQGDILYRVPDSDTHTGQNVVRGESFQHYLKSETNITRHIGAAVADNTRRLVVFAKVGDTGIDVAISARFDKIIARWYPLAVAKVLLFAVFSAGAIALYRQWQRRRMATLALAQSEAHFRELFGRAPIALAISDRQGRVLLVNQAFETLFGYRQEELPSVETFRQRVYPDPAERAQQEQYWRESWNEAAEETRRPSPVEATAVSRDGSTKTILISRQRLGDDMLVAIIDITARKEAEEKVRELSQAIEQSPEAIVITDLDANIQYVNDAFVASSGYGRDELLGQNARLQRSGRAPNATYDALWASLRQGRTWSGELINRRKDGTEYTEFAIVSPMRDSNGRITHYFAVKQDITEKKRLTEELDRHRHHLQQLVDERTRELEIARTNAEVASVAKSAFLANMSHEIRTPMNGVLGMAHLLRRSGLTEKQTSYVDKIEVSGNHLLAVINDILDISRIEAGKLQIDETEFFLNDLIRDVTDIVGQSAVDKGLLLRIDVGDAPQEVRGDRKRLRQALVNYLSNAVKFAERGKITLRCHTLERREKDSLVQFEVEDTGTGIPPDDLVRLFQSFEQADNSATRKHGGAGLGLAITKRIAELMGGTAGARSEPGKGSTFWLTVRLGRTPHDGHGPA